MNDTLKDDLIALALFKEILTYEFSSTNSATEYILKHAEEYMKQVMHYTFLTEKICRADNQTCLHSGVQDYVDVLNYRSSEDVNNNNYRHQFYLEMDKAHLFYLLGRTDIALDFLYNMEGCGLDFDEQRHVNKWKYIWETETAKINFGPEADLIDTIWVDTSGYYLPVHQTPGNFGSIIINEKTVQFNDCSGTKTPIADNGLNFSVFPNPSDGNLNIQYSLPDESVGYVVITGVDGKEIFRFQCFTGSNLGQIDISHVESGVYLYTFIVDEEPQESGKLIIH